MTFGISTLIPLFAIILYAILLVIVLLSKPSTQAKSAFRNYLFVMFTWSVTALFVVIGRGDNTTWFRLMSASVLAVPIAVFHLIQVSLAKPRRWAKWIYFYGVVIIPLTALTNLVVKSAFVDATGIYYEFAFLMGVIAIGGYGLYMFCLVDLNFAIRTSDEPGQRNRLRYLLVGLIIIMITSVVNFTPLGKYPIDIAGTALAGLIINYAVLKHQLMDIEVVIRKSLIYFIPTTIIGASYFFIITLVTRIFEAYSGVEILLTSLLVAILSAILVQPLRDRAQSWVDRLFFREKYDSNLMLQRVSKTATTYLEINILANMILKEIVSTLHIKKAAFFLMDNLSREFRLIAHHNLGKNVNFRLAPDHIIASHLEKSSEALTRREINILPQFRYLLEHEKFFLDRLETELFIPLKVQGNLIGILAVGQKRSEQPYNHNDQSTIITLANQTAVAIENARLYTAEQTRRREMDALYTLSRELVATEAMRSVLEKVVSHSLESIHVTFARILLREDNWSYTCQAIHPVYGLDYDLRLGKKEPEILYRYYEQSFEGDDPLVLDRGKLTLTHEEIHGLFLMHVQSLCICPLRIGDEPIGVLLLGERRHTNREPFDAEKLRLAKAIADQASSAIQRARLHDQLEENFVQTVLALANAIDARDSYTSDHSERLAKLATATARRLGCSSDEIQAINWAMHLHDIGKIGTPDEILQKPGPLTHEEWLIIQRHPEIGANIIAPVKKLKNVAPLIMAHHERYDGTGYPRKLEKDQIPLGAKILTIVDSYGAITDDRVYRNARTHEEAIAEISRCIGRQFDPMVAEAFLDAVEEFHKDEQAQKRNDPKAISEKK